MKEVSRARSYLREELLVKEPSGKKQQKLTLSIIHGPNFQNLKEILKNLYNLLTPDNFHELDFAEIPTVGFKNNKSLEGES